MKEKLKVSLEFDSKDFEKGINKIKSDANKLHNELKSMTDWVNTNKIDKVDSSLNKVKSSAKKVRAEISKSHELKLKVDDYEMKIKSSSSKLRWLREETEDTQKLKLDIQKYKEGLNEAKKELGNFVNTWKTEVNKLQQSFNSLWKAVAWAIAVDKVIDKILSVEELQQRLVVESWLTAQQARMYWVNVEAQAIRSWIKKEDYFNAYINSVRQWIVWPWSFDSSIIKQAALAEQKWYSSEEFLKSIVSIQKTYKWASKSDIAAQVFGLISSKWIQDVEKDIPNLLAEYAPLLEERWFKFWETLNVLIEASKQWTFNLDKPLDLIKEQWAKITDKFLAWDKWDLTLLNTLFKDDFQDLVNQYKGWEISAKQVWEVLAWKTEQLSKSDQLKMILDFYWTQAEDLWTQNVIKLLQAWKWIDSERLLLDLKNQAKFTLSETAKTSYWIGWSIERVGVWFSWLVSKIQEWTWNILWDWDVQAPISIVNNNYSTDATIQNQVKNNKDLSNRQAK